MLKWAGFWLLFLLLLLAQRPARSPAIPLFAHQYGVTCEKCHSVIPHLNEFGAAFLANGERFPGISSGPAVPFSVKANVVNSSEYQGEGPNGAGLPKTIVDEIEAFSSATIGSRANYFVEQYVVDGGEPGLFATLGSASASIHGRQRFQFFCKADSSRFRCRSIPKPSVTRINHIHLTCKPSARIRSTSSIRRWVCG